MKCMFATPEDAKVQCVRTSTQRFGEQVEVAVSVSGSRALKAFAYTCDEHVEHGPALAHKMAEAWSGQRIIATLNVDQEPLVELVDSEA